MNSIFLENKYTQLYYSIITRGQNRQLSGYTEKHHIIPRSMGGSNSSDNLVALTAKEHFLCHLLLTRITTGESKKKMILAIFKMMGKGKREQNNVVKNSRMYENLKKELSQIVSKQHRGRKRPVRTDEYRKKQAMAKLGKKNHRFRGLYITPWGIYESSRLAAASCPVRITDPYILRLCTINNHKPITLLSVCRSKEYLTKDHIGKTPFDLGFSFQSFSTH